MGRKRTLIDKQTFKKQEGKCRLCGEDDYDALDVHRWDKPGAKGGSYTRHNVICLCSSCHRKIEGKSPEVIITGRHFCSDGRWVYSIVKNGQEEFI